MNQKAAAELAAWITAAGLRGDSEVELLSGFCERAVAAGLPLASGLVIVDTLHPVHEGRAFRWNSEAAGQSEVVEYGRTTGSGEDAERWRSSPMFHMMKTGDTSMRRRIGAGDPLDFPALVDAKEAGRTDFLALLFPFAPTRVIGEMDCVYASWTSDAPSGFADDEVASLSALAPSLALAIKAAALAQIARTLVETYLGRDAGRRVLDGRIERGVADRIEAALWFSDLRGFTRITAGSPPDQIIPFLNDYAEAIISAVHECGGDVLKLIGDGTLALFRAADGQAEACRCALRAEELAQKRVAALNERRGEAGLPVTEAYFGLHVGEVFYGNVGSVDRLDFTVVGPAVNEVSRIVTMCRSAERTVLASKAFVLASRPEDRGRFVSVGRYALRGVPEPQELFTFDQGRDAAPAPADG